MAKPTDIGAIRRRFDQLPSKLQPALNRYSRRVLAPRGRQIAREEIRRSVRRRSGRLQESAETLVYPTGRSIITRLRLRHPAAYTLGKTGSTTITSKRPNGALAIPVGPALKPDGTQRYPGGPRTVPVKLHLVAFRGGATLRDADGEVWFVLKRSITVKGRGFLPRIRSRWQRESARLATAYTAKLIAGKVRP